MADDYFLTINFWLTEYQFWK